MAAVASGAAAAAMASLPMVLLGLLVAMASLRPASAQSQVYGDPCSSSRATIIDGASVDFPPGGATYTRNQDCRWSLSCSDPELAPLVTFTSFHAGWQDYVYAYEGTYVQNNNYFARLTGSNLPAPLGFAAGATGILRFDSDNNYQTVGAGFHATVTCAAPINACMGVGLSLLDGGDIDF
jgi:hypothetical protein